MFCQQIARRIARVTCANFYRRGDCYTHHLSEGSFEGPLLGFCDGVCLKYGAFDGALDGVCEIVGRSEGVTDGTRVMEGLLDGI